MIDIIPGVEMLGKILPDGLVNCRSLCIHQDDGRDLACRTQIPNRTGAVAVVLRIVADTGLPMESFGVEFDGRRLEMGVSEADNPVFSIYHIPVGVISLDSHVSHRSQPPLQK